MYQWDTYTKEQKRRLRSLQITREDDWRNEALVRFEQCAPDQNIPVQDKIDEYSEWFAQAVHAYMEQLTEDSRERARLPEWLH